MEGNGSGGKWRGIGGGSNGFGGIVKGRRGNEGDHDKLSEKERDLQLCLDLNVGENEKNKKLNKEKKLKLQKKKVINLSLQNLSGSGNSELGGESERSENMATLKPGGNGGNGGGNEEDRRRSMEFLLDTDKEKNAHLRVSINLVIKVG